MLASHKITMIPPPATEAEPAAGAIAPRVRERPDHEELVPDLEAFLKAHPEIKSFVKMALVGCFMLVCRLLQHAMVITQSSTLSTQYTLEWRAAPMLARTVQASLKQQACMSHLSHA